MHKYLGPDLGADPSGGALFFQHRNEYPEDIVTTGANGVATDPVVSEGGPSSDLDGFSGSLHGAAWICASA